ncbi:protein lifeguard 1-like [Galendromus occidentalis]|uniref:Protein lifeguard 1-like n=1 Tax=Galendromus occidentalis TaxID=34638 RepID=A0AAJ6W073_9ACAR|nr:protein lifeguard 1-like [Galendromus occidentalis]
MGRFGCFSLVNIERRLIKLKGAERIYRQNFVRNLYLLLSIQHGLTTACILFCARRVLSDAFRLFVSSVLLIVAFVVVCRSKKAKRVDGKNLQLFLGLSLAFAFNVTMLTIYEDLHITWLTLGMLSVCCLGIAIFTCQSRFDFISCVGFIYMCVFGAFIYSLLLAGVYGYHPQYEKDAALVFLTLSLLYMYVYTYILMEGKRVDIYYEEYVFGAIFIYTDIFMWLWSLIKRSTRKLKGESDADSSTVTYPSA